MLTDLLKSLSVQLLLFSLDGFHYAVRLLMVERVIPMVEVSPLPNAPPIALGVINYHGKIVAVVDIRRRLNGPSREYGLADKLVVARTARRILLFPVDEVLGVRRSSRRLCGSTEYHPARYRPSRGDRVASRQRSVYP